MALSVVAIVILTSIVIYSADAAGIPKKAISTVSRFIESDLPATTLFTDVQNTITSIQQFTITSAVFENPAKTFGTTLSGGAVTANRTLNLPAITGTDTVATLGLAQTFTGAQTINSLILGGDVNVGSNSLTNSGHKSTLPSNTGILLQRNGTGAYLTNNVRGVTTGTGITVNGSTGTVQVTNAGVTSATGTADNVTVSASTGAVTWNLGSNVVTTNGALQNITKGLQIMGFSGKYHKVTAAYTPTANDDFIEADTSSSSFAVTLPSAVTMQKGKVFVIENSGLSAAQKLQILTTSSQTIDGDTNLNMTFSGQKIGVVSDGSNWQIFKNLDTSWDGFYIKGSTTRWYGNSMSALAPSTQISVVSTLRASPWIVPHTITIDKIQAEISTAANPTSTTCRIGIYTDTGFVYPDNLVTGSDVGTFTTTAGVKPNTFGSPITLPEGLYWLAYSCGSAATTQPTWRALSGGAVPPVLGAVSTMGTNNMGTAYTVAFTFAALPQTYPAGATILASNVLPAQILVEIQKG